jgi:hypothetical protein
MKGRDSRLWDQEKVTELVFKRGSRVNFRESHLSMQGQHLDLGELKSK